LAWPYGMSTQQENPGTRTEEANKCPPVTACTFRNDGSSQGTYISSLATMATRESSAEKSKGNHGNEGKQRRKIKRNHNEEVPVQTRANGQFQSSIP
jgi:hypothetical protein